MAKPHDVRFRCGGNSGQSTVAEATADRERDGHVRGFSAGSTQHRGEMNPCTLQPLERQSSDTGSVRAKKPDDVARPEGPQIDIVFTVRTFADTEDCVWWAGRPKIAPRDVEEPAFAIGSETERHPAFSGAFRPQRHRISFLLHPAIGVRGAMLGTEPA